MKTDILTSTFISFRTVLHGMATRIVGSSEDADDAIHDAFCRLWSRHPEVKDTTEAMKLSYTAVRNSAIDALRRHRGGRSVSMESVPSVADTAAEEADGQEETEHIYKSVVELARRVLSARQFEVFSLHDIEGVPYDEISEQLGMTTENVRMTLSRTRKTIREVYRQKFHDEP